jgi:hypothetical protein
MITGAGAEKRSFGFTTLQITITFFRIAIIKFTVKTFLNVCFQYLLLYLNVLRFLLSPVRH